jgi:hypothetical protein
MCGASKKRDEARNPSQCSSLWVFVGRLWLVTQSDVVAGGHSLCSKSILELYFSIHRIKQR